MRAPPLAEKQTSGMRCSMQWFTARTKRSPTTAPMEPPMKANSKAQTTSGMPDSSPCMTTSASVSPVFFCAWASRSLYFLLSLNLSTSRGRTSAASSVRGSSSRKVSSRRRAPMRM